MTTLKQHIDNGPYRVDDTGGIIDANTRLIGRSYLAEVDPDEQFTLAMNFPSRVLAVLRERYNEQSLVQCESVGDQWAIAVRDEILQTALDLTFTREDITK
jgi:hypothetical protein